MRVARSLLFVPGDRPDLMMKAVAGHADALIVDLEDAVVPSAKVAARESLTALISETPISKPVWVRVSSGEEEMDSDLVVVGDLADRLAGVFIAKAETREHVESAAKIGLPIGLFVETARAVLSLESLVDHPLVRTIHLGEADLAADTGLRPGRDDAELAWARSRVVFVSAAARLEPPVAPVSTEVNDMEDFRMSTERTARQGFLGRACIHPRQVTVANRVFTPSAAEVESARALLAQFAQSVEIGRGALIVDGKMVDEAVVRAARRIVASAETDAE